MAAWRGGERGVRRGFGVAPSHLQQFADGGVDFDPRIGLLNMIDYLCGLLPAEGSERRKQGCFGSSRLGDVFDFYASH